MSFDVYVRGRGAALLNGVGSVLNRLAARTDTLIAVAVLVGVVLLIVPLPTEVLDFMVAISLTSSLLILIGATYAKSMLDYSTLPTVLLVTTLFRLSLEIAITRVVLLEAHAGEIVRSFGEIVAGGNLAVGLVIFSILTIVNFIVITKGSERVAEVSARFSLDAMPGKQMAIDAELRAGHISAEVATRRRSELARESQMHGAMDGAMKFVKGDAIASIVILVINLVGGIVIGTQLHGMSFGESARVFSILSIGEGLVALMPALLISVAAGILITLGDQSGRNDSGASTSSLVVAELFGSEKVLLVTGMVVLCIAVMPGLPALPFLPFGVLCIGVAVYRFVRTARASRQAALEQSQITHDEIYFSAAAPYRMEIAHDTSSGPLALRVEGEVRRLRNGIVTKGYMIPTIEMSRVIKSDRVGVRVMFFVNEVPFVDVVIEEGEHVTLAPPEQLAANNLTFALRRIVRGGREHKVIAPIDVERARASGIECVAAESMVARSIEEVVWMTCSAFINVREAQRIMNWALRANFDLYEEVKRLIPIQTLAQVIESLVDERVSLRNGFVILDTLCRWVGRERDVNGLVEQVRLALRYEICQQVAPESTLKVVLLSRATEDFMRASLRRSNSGTFLALSLEQVQRFIGHLQTLYVSHQTVSTPLALVVSEDLRPHVRRLLVEEFPSLPTLAFSELTGHVTVFPVGEIDVNPE